jgi:hypothetical protein
MEPEPRSAQPTRFGRRRARLIVSKRARRDQPGEVVGRAGALDTSMWDFPPSPGWTGQEFTVDELPDEPLPTVGEVQ